MIEVIGYAVVLWVVALFVSIGVVMCLETVRWILFKIGVTRILK